MPDNLTTVYIVLGVAFSILFVGVCIALRFSPEPKKPQSVQQVIEAPVAFNQLPPLAQSVALREGHAILDKIFDTHDDNTVRGHFANFNYYFDLSGHAVQRSAFPDL